MTQEQESMSPCQVVCRLTTLLRKNHRVDTPKLLDKCVGVVEEEGRNISVALSEDSLG